MHKLTWKKKESRRRGRFDSKRDKITRSIREAEDEGDTEESQRLENELQDYDNYTDELNKEAMEFLESKDVKMNIPPLPRKEWMTIIEEKPKLWKDKQKELEAEGIDINETLGLDEEE